MTDFDIPYVKPERDRNGRIRYWYFRRHGRRWRLPGEPLSEEFMAEHRRLVAATLSASKGAERATFGPGSFGALVADYFGCKIEFGEKKPSTQKIYRLILEPLSEAHGHKPVLLLERRHIKQWRDARSETPGMANMVVKVARVLLAYAVDNEYRRDNPAARIKLFKLGEHRAWTDKECAAFKARWPAGTMQRRAYLLAKFTGQRCGDIAAHDTRRPEGWIHSRGAGKDRHQALDPRTPRCCRRAPGWRRSHEPTHQGRRQLIRCRQP